MLPLTCAFDCSSTKCSTVTSPVIVPLITMSYAWTLPVIEPWSLTTSRVCSPARPVTLPFTWPSMRNPSLNSRSPVICTSCATSVASLACWMPGDFFCLNMGDLTGLGWEADAAARDASLPASVGLVALALEERHVGTHPLQFGRGFEGLLL